MKVRSMSSKGVSYYTGRGDKGYSYTLKNKVSKDSDLIQAAGDVDELQAFLGYAWGKTKDKRIRTIIEQIVYDLYLLNAVIAGFEGNVFSEGKTKDLERLIDLYAKKIKPIKSFVYPFGTEAAILINICRTLARKAERSIVKVTKDGDILSYMNRLSSLLYVLYRYENERNGFKDKTLRIK